MQHTRNARLGAMHRAMTTQHAIRFVVPIVCGGDARGAVCIRGAYLGLGEEAHDADHGKAAVVDLDEQAALLLLGRGLAWLGSGLTLMMRVIARLHRVAR